MCYLVCFFIITQLRLFSAMSTLQVQRVNGLLSRCRHFMILANSHLRQCQHAQHDQSWWRVEELSRADLSVLQFLIRMSLELPPETSDLMAGWSSNPLPGAVDPLALVHSTWALEAFIDVSACILSRFPSCFAYVLGKSHAGGRLSPLRCIISL